MRSKKTFIALAIALTSFACSTPDDTPTAVDEEPILLSGEQSAWVYYTFSGGIDIVRSWNSTGGSIGVTNVPTGTYTVTLNGYTSSDGNTQVTALAKTTAGTDNSRCKTSNQTLSGGALIITVLCHDGAGNASNTGFMLSYAHFTGGHTASTKGAYVYMDQLTGGFGLNSARMWGDNITSSHLATGSYRITLPAHSTSDGNLIVTSSGT